MRPAAPAASRVRPPGAVSPYRRGPRPLPAAGLTAAVLLAACGGRDTPGGPDGALDRDLTLASSVARAPVGPAALGDTAATTPAAPPPPAARAVPTRERAPRAAPAPANEPTAAPVRRAPPRRAPAADAPTEVASAPLPVPSESVPPSAAAAPAPAAPAAGAGRSIAAGTVLAGTLGQRVCTESNRPGDRFVATLGGAVSGSGGATLPAGTPVVLEFAGASGDPPRVEFAVRGVSVGGEFVPVVADAEPVTGDVERRRVVDKPGDAAGKAVQGAVVGAILGRVLGGGKGTVIGAAGGAAAGAAMGRGRAHEEVCLAAGAPVRVRLGEALAAR